MDPLASLAELEKHMQTTFATTPEQDQATLALELASGAVRAYCGWPISRTQEIIEAYGEESTVLTLPTLMLQGVTAVTVDGTDLNMGDGSIVWTVKGQVYRRDGWHRFSVVTLDIDHGYDVIPDLIKLVTLDLAGKQMNNPQGLVSATVGEVSRTYSNSSTATLSTLHQNLLDRYRVF